MQQKKSDKSVIFFHVKRRKVKIYPLEYSVHKLRWPSYFYLCKQYRYNQNYFCNEDLLKYLIFLDWKIHHDLKRNNNFQAKETLR